jgi:hypothetical protein
VTDWGDYKCDGDRHTESRQQAQGYWVRHAQKRYVCLVARTDRGVPLTLRRATPFGVTLPPTHPSVTLNLVNINKLGIVNRANRMGDVTGAGGEERGVYPLEEQAGAMRVGIEC